MNSRSRKANPNSPLYQAILKLKTPEECYNFLMDLCTVPELNAMEQRFEVAQLLNQGMIYNKILELTGQLRNHQPCEPLPQLWYRRLPLGD